MRIKDFVKSWSEASQQALLSALTQASAQQPPPDLSNDLLEGAAAIGKFIYGDDSSKSRRRVYHLADQNREDRLPVFRLGQQIFARKSTLLRWIAEREGGVAT
jgi:hypothetical protein